MNRLGLYIHIPYCVKKCGYCSFVSGCDFSNAENYFRALNKEIENSIEGNKTESYTVDTIFFGGGTPSAVKPEYIESSLKKIYSSFEIDKDIEITVECNPESLDEKKLDCYLKNGVNRISLGIQSLDDNLLEVIQRAHDSKTALNSLKLIKSSGIKNINCDIMLNLPGQTYEHILDTVNKILEFDIQHISCYSLSLEEGTPLYNSGVELNEDRAAEYYEKLLEYLNSKGFKRYEVSNFAKEGFGCRHNLKYWKCLPYLGFGASAHSYFYEYRNENISDVNDYIFKIKNNLSAAINIQKIGAAEKEFEFIICNLRLEEGFSLKEFKQLFEVDFLEKYKEKLFKLNRFFVIDKNIKLKKDSFYILNSILTEIV